MKEEILIKFGERIRTLRKQNKWSQEKLAEETGFHRTYIGMIERGERNPSLISINVFAKTFKMTISELLFF
ncbi:MAG: helix-turn-helix domain-containing protein [Bacteroidaceae bacterium]|jgi:transcriptional regulator with XRE-family HTH domain